MCLSIPAKIEQIEGNEAIVNLSGNRLKIALDLLDDVHVGDFVLVHAGYAIQKVDEKEAEETLQLIRLLEDEQNQIVR
jgi:hydrogenase expression/formation protein HypC